MPGGLLLPGAGRLGRHTCVLVTGVCSCLAEGTLPLSLTLTPRMPSPMPAGSPEPEGVNETGWSF